MAKVLVTESYLEDIGDAIRAKLETQDTYTPSEMAGAIRQISGGATLISKTITQNGTYNAVDDSADGYSDVTVEVPGGGSGNTTYMGTTDPLPAQGVKGDFYIKYVHPGESGGAIPRNYTLNITKGLRGSSELTYVGAQEIQLFYDDGNGNEVNVRTLPNFTYTASGNSSSTSAMFDGNTSGSYWESYPTPITVTFSATVPSEYTLKKFVVWQRRGSYTSDVWADFTLTETIGAETNTIISEVGLTVNDWAGAGYGTEWDLSDAPMPSIVILATYAKVGETSATAEWVEAPIEVNVGSVGPILSGTDAPTSDVGENEDVYIKYSEMSASYDHSIKIDAQYRKVNGVWEDYTIPEPPTKGVHIWTKSTGGNDAAMYVQDGFWDTDNEQFVATGEVISVIYTSVQSTDTYDCYGIATLGYPSNWNVYATDSITDGTDTFASGDLVKSWRYSASVDFYIWKNV